MPGHSVKTYCTRTVFTGLPTLFTPKMDVCFQTMFSFLGQTSENMCLTWISCSGARYVLKNKHGIWLTLSGPLRYTHKEYKSFATIVLPTFPNLIYEMRTFSVVATWPKLGDPYSNRTNWAIAPSFQHFSAILQVARLPWACCFSVAVIKHGDQRHLKTWQQEQIQHSGQSRKMRAHLQSAIMKQRKH